MKISSLVLASFRHYWRSHLGLLFGAFLAAAILSGSLLVGDSVRASLRRAAELRLGEVRSGLVGGDRWFTEALARGAGAAPLIVARGSASEASGGRRVNAVQVLGVDDAFWKLRPRQRGADGDSPAGLDGGRSGPGKDWLAVNEGLAHRLGVKAGDTLVVRLEKPSAISRDAPLSGETNQEISVRRRVAAIIEGEGFGDFQLQAAQTAPDNVFLPLPELAEALEQKGRVNAFVSGRDLAGPASADLSRAATLEDYSLKLVRLPAAAGVPARGEWEITTERVFLDEVLARRILDSVPGSYGVLTYLVNGLSSARGRTPYSMVTALPEELHRSGFGLAGSRVPASETVVVNQWLADDLQVGVGDRIGIRYFTVGLGRDLREESAEFVVGGVVPMTDAMVNPGWAPDFPGVTDARNCRDWQPGIPMKLDAIRDKDEAYWQQFKTTPKAFVTLSAGRRLWANRFGNLTAIRFPAGAGTVPDEEARWRERIAGVLRLSEVGLVPRDFRSEAAQAAKGSVDFGGLFVGLSLFIIAAALVFGSLLFLFTLERRASQIGLLLALGWRVSQVRAAVLLESGLVAVVGAGLGLLGGWGYTVGAVAGLNSIWSGATAGLKLIHELRMGTLAVAWLVSLAASVGTLALASRRIFRARPRDLLAGEAWGRTGAERRDATAAASFSQRLGAAGARWFPAALVALAAILAVAGGRAADPMSVAGLFFGSGFGLLAAGLLVVRRWLRVPESRSGREDHAVSINAIGIRNVTRRPGRSLAVIGMMAGGIFLVIAVNAFRLGADADPNRRASGTGGFALVGDSTLPVYEDLNSAAARDAFALDDDLVKGAAVVPFRVREGEDASCLNLNRAQRPVLCAVNPRLLAERRAFRFAAGSWESLAAAGAGSVGEIPGVVDQATAQWGLGKGVGDAVAFTDAQGREFRVRIAALLAGSILQGKIIVPEDDFLRKFPDIAGYRFFLVDAPADRSAAIRSHLNQQLEIRGLALDPAPERLAAFNAVQNTYIGIFTALGGLGVLLGTAGLGVLAMRNVLERRGEFGLMQALGFRPRVLRRMVVGEHAALLVAGLLLGVLCAALAVWPNLRQSGGDLPVAFLLTLLLGILVFGIVACWWAAVLALRGRLLDALRRE